VEESRLFNLFKGSRKKSFSGRWDKAGPGRTLKKKYNFLKLEKKSEENMITKKELFWQLP